MSADPFASGDIEVTFDHVGPLGMQCVSENGVTSVSQLMPGSQAASHPLMRTGLILKTINGRQMHGQDGTQVMEALKAVSRPVSLTFALFSTGKTDERGTVTATFDSAGPIGMTLEGVKAQTRGQVTGNINRIAAIAPGGAASQNFQLAPQMVLMSVQGFSGRNLPYKELMSYLKLGLRPLEMSFKRIGEQSLNADSAKDAARPITQAGTSFYVPPGQTPVTEAPRQPTFMAAIAESQKAPEAAAAAASGAKKISSLDDLAAVSGATSDELADFTENDISELLDEHKVGIVGRKRILSSIGVKQDTKGSASSNVSTEALSASLSAQLGASLKTNAAAVEVTSSKVSTLEMRMQSELAAAKAESEQIRAELNGLKAEMQDLRRMVAAAPAAAAPAPIALAPVALAPIVAPAIVAAAAPAAVAAAAAPAPVAQGSGTEYSILCELENGNKVKIAVRATTLTELTNGIFQQLGMPVGRMLVYDADFEEYAVLSRIDDMPAKGKVQIKA